MKDRAHKTEADRLSDIVTLIYEYGSIDGAHHKQWVLDQVLRLALKEKEYDALVRTMLYGTPEERESEGLPVLIGKDEEPMYEWDEGIAP